MGKVIDWLMTGGDWEEMQRIQVYKKVGKKIDTMSDDDLKGLSKQELIKMLKKKK